VQVPIANEKEKFWTQGQVRMAVDTYIQQVALGGIGVRRGNGHLSGERRWSVAAYGMSETITDDLDLTLRLHLDQWDIEVVSFQRCKKRADKCDRSVAPAQPLGGRGDISCWITGSQLSATGWARKPGICSCFADSVHLTHGGVPT